MNHLAYNNLSNSKESRGREKTGKKKKKEIELGLSELQTAKTNSNFEFWFYLTSYYNKDFEGKISNEDFEFAVVIIFPFSPEGLYVLEHFW